MDKLNSGLVREGAQEGTVDLCSDLARAKELLGGQAGNPRRRQGGGGRASSSGERGWSSPAQERTMKARLKFCCWRLLVPAARRGEREQVGACWRV